jgi:hypothetical protein
MKISLFVLGCSMTGYGSTTPDISTPYCNLMNDPASFAGKRILVRAVYRYGFEIQRLDATECCPGKKLKIWVEMQLSDRKSRRLFDKFPKGMGFALATFGGVFETGGPYGDGDYRFRLTVSHIESVEATAHPSEAGNPPWTAADCSSQDGKTPNGQTFPPPHDGGRVFEKTAASHP